MLKGESMAMIWYFFDPLSGLHCCYRQSAYLYAIADVTKHAMQNPNFALLDCYISQRIKHRLLPYKLRGQQKTPELYAAFMGERRSSSIKNYFYNCDDENLGTCAVNQSKYRDAFV